MNNINYQKKTKYLACAIIYRLDENFDRCWVTDEPAVYDLEEEGQKIFGMFDSKEEAEKFRTCFLEQTKNKLRTIEPEIEPISDQLKLPWYPKKDFIPYKAACLYDNLEFNDIKIIKVSVFENNE